MFSFFDIPTWNKVVRRTYCNTQPIALFANSSISFHQSRLYLVYLFNYSLMAKKLFPSLALIFLFSISYAQKASVRHLEEGLFTLKADAQSATISKEIIDLRDEYSKTYLNSEGVYTKQSSDFPMHYRGNDGQWYTYDKQMTLQKREYTPWRKLMFQSLLTLRMVPPFSDTINPAEGFCLVRKRPSKSRIRQVMW